MLYDRLVGFVRLSTIIAAIILFIFFILKRTQAVDSIDEVNAFGTGVSEFSRKVNDQNFYFQLTSIIILVAILFGVVPFPGSSMLKELLEYNHSDKGLTQHNYTKNHSDKGLTQHNYTKNHSKKTGNLEFPKPKPLDSNLLSSSKFEPDVTFGKGFDSELRSGPIFEM